MTLITEFADNYRDLADSEALRMISESLSIERDKLAVKGNAMRNVSALSCQEKRSHDFFKWTDDSMP